MNKIKISSILRFRSDFLSYGMRIDELCSNELLSTQRNMDGGSQYYSIKYTQNARGHPDPAERTIVCGRGYLIKYLIIRK